MEEPEVAFYSNAYFDDLIGFINIDVHTSQDKFKPFKCSQCERDLYEGREKKNKTEFVKLIKERLSEMSHPLWPYKNDLFLQISVTNSKSKIQQADIDNLVKTVLDAIKGIVFVDDSQVVSVFAEKGTLREIPMSSFLFAIRELHSGERAVVQESLWSANENYTKELREERIRNNKPSLFYVFTMGESKTAQISKEKYDKLMRDYEKDRDRQ